ncbi:MAG: hypothetical protein R3Y05_04630 [bacterium]
MKLAQQNYNSINNSQSRLLEELHLLRLNIDLMLINTEILNHQEVIPTDDANIFTKVTYQVKNDINSIKTEKLVKEKEIVEYKIKQISEKTVDYDEVLDLINETFKEDENDISRYLFSITLVNEQKEYIYDDISLKTVSTMLWKDESFLKSLKISFKEVYVKIGAANLSDKQKYALTAAAGISIASCVLVAPVVLATLSLPLTISAFTIATITGVSLTVGSTYAGMSVMNKTLVKKDFKQLNYDEITYILAMKSMLLDYSFKTLPPEGFKEYLNDVLLMTSDLKSDSLYYALVEKTDSEKNEKLTDAYYRFDKHLLKKYKI